MPAHEVCCDHRRVLTLLATASCLSSADTLKPEFRDSFRARDKGAPVKAAASVRAPEDAPTMRNKNRTPIRMNLQRRWTFPLNAAFYLSASLAGMSLLVGCAATKPPEAKASTGWVKDQVADAYTFGFPLVASDIARERASGSAAQSGRAPLDT